jgi:hypothetical protein
MPHFSYTAKTIDGKTTSGSIEAVSLQAARSALQSMKLLPEHIEEKKTADDVIDWSFEKNENPAVAPKKGATAAASAPRTYFPIVDTLRLYVGWVLAGYVLALLLGAYQLTKPLPFEIPFVLSFLYSPLILQLTLAGFLFLLFSTVHRFLGGGLWRGTVLTVLAVAALYVYRINIV